MASALARSDSQDHRQQALEYLAAAELLLGEHLSKFWRARLYYVRAFVAQLNGSVANALVDLERSVEIYPESSNGAVRDLLRLYARLGRAEDFRGLRKRVFVDEPVPEEIREWGRAMRRTPSSNRTGNAGNFPQSPSP